MIVVGELCLLAAFVASGFAAVACVLAERGRNAKLLRCGQASAVAATVALTGSLIVLAQALLAKDFTFDYVAKYSSRVLAWHYSLSALWVGQAGSLLLWAWMTVVLAMIFRFVRRTATTRLQDLAFGIVMGYVCFLSAIMVFAADPMKPSIVAARDGAGLSPLLQHPAMMIHPPIIFAGYAAWTIPFALALSALILGRFDRSWLDEARPWAILAWAVLGTGVLLGADWAYEELGWGGYWGWDPVENGSLIPWLTGTVLIHALMVWHHRDGLKKTALALAIITFGLCNFATFLTRSGIFSSLHAFSESPIGWMFLALMIGLAAVGGALIFWRRHVLVATMTLDSIWARETVVVVAAVSLLLLAAIIFVGTVVLPASTYAMGKKAVIGPDFYNAVLAPIGLLLLAATVPVPLLRWGGPPKPLQRRLLLLSAIVGLAAGAVALGIGVRRAETLLVTILAAAAPISLVSAFAVDVGRRSPRRWWPACWLTLHRKKRSYAGYVIHLGFVSIAMGITGSSLGYNARDAVMSPGDVLNWNGRAIRYVQLVRSELPDKLVVAADLEVREQGGQSYLLSPARHFHRLAEQWTTEVAIHSSWCGDFYTILNNREQDTAVALTFRENPLMRWLWLGGGLSLVGAVATLWPSRRRKVVRGRQSLSTSKANGSSISDALRRAA